MAKQSKKQQSKKPSPRKPSASVKAIVRIPLPAAKPWELNREEVVLVKNLICKGASDEEFQMCMARARHHRLDPLKQQIWFVPRFDRSAENANGTTGRKIWVAQVGIAGIRHVAARDHKDYGTEDDAKYGPMIEVEYISYGKSHKMKVPSSATVAVWKRGATRPTEATVFWEEIYPNLEHAPLVRQMPRLMLAKCAAAQANRKAYPETGGLYIAEEFAGRRPDYTPEGRLINYPVDQDVPVEGSHEAAVAVAQEKIAQLREKASKPVAPVSDVPSAKLPPPPPPMPGNGTIEVEWLEQDAIVRGDLGEILEDLKKRTTMVWIKDWWHVTHEDVKKIGEVCAEKGYRFTELLPKSSPGSAMQGSTAATGKGGGSPRTPAPAAAEVLSGTIKQANPSPSGQKPHLNVLLQDGKVAHWLGSWNRDHWPFLTKGIGEQAIVLVQKNGKWNNLVAINKIKNTLFDEDGKTPIIQRSTQEAGAKSLF